MPISIRRAWILLAGAHLAITAWTVVTLVFLPGRIGRVGLLQCVLGAGVLIATLLPGKLAQLRGRVPLALVFTVWGALCFGLGIIGRELWLYAAISLLAGATGALLIYTISDERHMPARALWGGLALVAVGVYAVRAWALSVYPLMEMTDEPWLLSFVKGYERVGYLHPEITLGYTPYQDVIVPRMLLLLAGWTQIVGLGYWEGRLFFLLMCVLVVVFTALAARDLYDTPTALLTALTLVSSMVLAQAGRIRYEVGVALCVAVSLWLFAMGTIKGKRALYLLAGAVMGLGAFAHLHAAPLGIVMAVALFAPHIMQNWRAGVINGLLYGTGGLAIAVVYVVVQVLPNPDLYFAATLVRAADDPSSFGMMLWGHLRNVYWHSRAEYLLILGGLAAAMVRRRPFDLSLVLAVMLGHITLGLITSTAFIHYVRVLAPLYALLVGALLSAVMRSDATNPQPDLRPVVAGALVMLPLLGSTLAAPLAHIAAGGTIHTPPPRAVERVHDIAPTDATLLGSHTYYLWFHDYRYGSVMVPNMIEDHLQQDVDAAQMWRDVAPDIVIWDGASPGWMRPESVWDYMAREGFREVARFDDVVIYAR